ncbi:hypothetical protein BGZ76_010832, partial [Entomortierella beljakovae]
TWQRKIKVDSFLNITGANKETKEATRKRVFGTLLTVLTSTLCHFVPCLGGERVTGDYNYFKLAAHNVEAAGETDEANDETDGANDETDGANGDVNNDTNNEVDNEANGDTNGDSNECDFEAEDTGSNKNPNARYKTDQWMICYRQNIDYAQIYTSNLIEHGIEHSRCISFQINNNGVLTMLFMCSQTKLYSIMSIKTRML